MKKILPILMLICMFLLLSDQAFSQSVIDQTGNLLVNGNFETGTLSPWMIWPPSANPGLGVSDDRAVDGMYSVFYDADLIYSGSNMSGYYQYTSATGGTGSYTVSGWFYVEQGAARLGISWYVGTLQTWGFSPLAAAADQWQYLEYTVPYRTGTGGPLVYRASSDTVFYADGLWYNPGLSSTSPYSPQNGFDPNAQSPVPEPATLVLLALGIIGLAGRQVRSNKRRI